MIMILHVASADDAALERGVAAAQAVLNEARITAAEAALGHWACAEWKRNGATRAMPPDGIMEAAAAFALAEVTAISACCDGRHAPLGSWLELSDT